MTYSVDLLVRYSNLSQTERGVRGGRPRGQHDEWPLVRALRGQGPPRTLVEVAGIEPASFGDLTGLLRAQLALPLLGPTGHTSEPV